MPIHYFHCTDGEHLVVDRKGASAATPRQIRRRARDVANRLMDSLEHDWSNWLVCVHDDAGMQVAVLSFVGEGDETCERPSRGCDAAHRPTLGH